ncbi:MAG TPA: DUF4256 domain-containing protein [Bacteroidales bacterium]|nr:DUF4256 domain-containing protein [Bacteroidales bacterium]
MQTSTEKRVTPTEKERLLKLLRERFEKNMNRHKEVSWDNVIKRLDAEPGKINSLLKMEESGGEPDVTGYDEKTGKIIFTDCSPETPEGRRNTCYDMEGLAERIKKGLNPAGNAIDMAKETGIELLNEEQYRALQETGSYDLKTSSWILTPPDIRKKGGALFCDRRYGHVFVYHNGAPSFYSARGFRGRLVV